MEKKYNLPEVAKLLQPVIELHDIELKDDRMVFPGDTQKSVILYTDIICISPFDARIEVLLPSGELYTFSKADNVRTHINTHNGGVHSKSENPITAQYIAGNIWDGLAKKMSSGK